MQKKIDISFLIRLGADRFWEMFNTKNKRLRSFKIFPNHLLLALSYPFIEFNQRTTQFSQIRAKMFKSFPTDLETLELFDSSIVSNRA